MTGIRFIVAVLLALSALGLHAHTTLAALTCPQNESDVQAFVDAAGMQTLNCSVATTVTFASAITVTNDVTLDASGSSAPITFDGGGSTSFFTVNSGASL